MPELSQSDGTPERQLAAALERIAALERELFAFRMRDKGVGQMRRTWNTKDQVSEGVRADGVRLKATTDQLGNEVTEHADGRQDVNINLR